MAEHLLVSRLNVQLFDEMGTTSKKTQNCLPVEAVGLEQDNIPNEGHTSNSYYEFL